MARSCSVADTASRSVDQVERVLALVKSVLLLILLANEHSLWLLIYLDKTLTIDTCLDTLLDLAWNSG